MVLFVVFCFMIYKRVKEWKLILCTIGINYERKYV